MDLQYQTTSIVLNRLLMMTTRVDIFFHGSDHHILNNVTPWISQDIQIITQKLNYNKSPRTFTILKIRPKKGTKSVEIDLK